MSKCKNFLFFLLAVMTFAACNKPNTSMQLTQEWDKIDEFFKTNLK